MNLLPHSAAAACPSSGFAKKFWRSQALAAGLYFEDRRRAPNYYFQ